MTLEEAIKHCKQTAKDNNNRGTFLMCMDGEKDIQEGRDCLGVAREYEQYADWLEELQSRRDADIGDVKTDGTKVLKKTCGAYVTYNIEWLLNHLAREIYLLEAWRKQKRGE